MTRRRIIGTPILVAALMRVYLAKAHIGVKSASFLVSLFEGSRPIAISQIICHLTDAKKIVVRFLVGRAFIAGKPSKSRRWRPDWELCAVNVHPTPVPLPNRRIYARWTNPLRGYSLVSRSKDPTCKEFLLEKIV